MESDKKSLQQTSEHQDMKEELVTLRTKITKATADLKKAQAVASSAVQEARVAVTSELSQVPTNLLLLATHCKQGDSATVLRTERDSAVLLHG